MHRILHEIARAMMRSFSAWALSTFASPVGVFILAMLDSTLFFSLPFGIDAAVIILAARSDTLAWTVPLIATVGSLLGASITFWMGRKAGDAGLDRYLDHRQVDRVRRRVNESGAIVLALIDLLPPPFPFTPFVLAAGALKVRTWLFFSTLLGVRLLRFGAEGLLAAHYGKRVLAWFERDGVRQVVFGCIVLGAVLTAWTLWKFFKAGHRSRPSTAEG
jgi:membrane protein YqaA with SNARE-associated domain